MRPVSMSVNDACRYIGVGRTKLYDLIGSGEVPVIKIGRRTLVLTDAVDGFIARQIAAVPPLA